MTAPALVYYGEELGRYAFGDGHPFGPDRIQAFWREAVKQGVDKHVDIGAPVRCNEQALTCFHDREYIARVKRQSLSGRGYLDYGDTPAFPGIFEAACYVVGSDLEALTHAMEGSHTRIFVPIAGLHHARRDNAAGFCVFNDAGILIETLRRVFAVKKVAYVDIDAHHGDGVFYAFESDPDLLIADIHEDGRFLYPGTGFANETGKGVAQGTKLNIPLPPGADDTAFFKVWPAVEEFLRESKPEFVLLQAGADSIKGDPITDMAFSPRAHGHAARRLCALADEFCQGRIIAMGGGGYNRTNLALGWNEVLKSMVAQ